MGNTNNKGTAASDMKEPGLRHVKTTNVFRVVNFELFAKPNKRIMGIGGSVFMLCVGYIIYWRVTDDLKDKPTYNTMNDDGSFTRRVRKSKWE